MTKKQKKKQWLARHQARQPKVKVLLSQGKVWDAGTIFLAVFAFVVFSLLVFCAAIERMDGLI